MTIIAAEKGADKGPPPSADSRFGNGGELDITFVGAGSAFSKKYFQNNILVVKGGVRVLVDCGTRAPEALSRLGLSVTDIGAFLITHTHADHIGGLEEAMLIHRYVAKRKPRMIVTEKLRRILWTMSLRGGAQFNEVHDGKPLQFDDLWESLLPKRVRNAPRELCFIKEGDLEIGLFRTMHIPDSALGWEDSFPSYGLLLDRRVLFTSDSRFDPDMITWLESEYKLETIFQDCQFYPGGVHAFLDDLATLPASVKAKTWLMHYGDGMEGKRDRIRELGFAGVAEEWATYRFA